MNKIINFSLCFILVISFPVISEAAQIDFAWSTPEFLSYRKDSEDEKKYLIWCYSIRNTIDKEIIPRKKDIIKINTFRRLHGKFPKKWRRKENLVWSYQKRLNI